MTHQKIVFFQVQISKEQKETKMQTGKVQPIVFPIKNSLHL
jgi:hypothetical protein